MEKPVKAEVRPCRIVHDVPMEAPDRLAALVAGLSERQRAFYTSPVRRRARYR